MTTAFGLQSLQVADLPFAPAEFEGGASPSEGGDLPFSPVTFGERAEPVEMRGYVPPRLTQFLPSVLLH